MSKYFDSTLDEEKVGKKLIAIYTWFLFIYIFILWFKLQMGNEYNNERFS